MMRSRVSITLFSVALSSLALLLPNSLYGQALSDYTARHVQKAHELAKNSQVSDAIDTLLALKTKRAYDQAYVLRTLGVLYWQQGDTRRAIEALSQSVNSNALQDEQAWFTERMLADLYLNDHQFSHAVKHYQALLKTLPEGEKESDIWWRLAQAQYQLGQWQQVLLSINSYKRTNGEMALAQLSMELSALLQQQQWQASRSVLQAIIELEPNKATWWRQLASVQLRLGDRKGALNTLALAQLGNIALTKQDIHLLAQLYAQQGIPEQAASTLDKLDPHNQQHELVIEKAHYWQQAKEWQKAIETWSIAAQQEPKYYWDVALLWQQQKQFAKSLSALAHLDSKEPRVGLAKTQAYFRLSQLQRALVEAKRVYQNATTEVEIKQAQSWVEYIEGLIGATN